MEQVIPVKDSEKILAECCPPSSPYPALSQSRVSIAVKRHRDHGSSYKGKADLALGKELRVPHVGPQAAEVNVT